MTADQIEKSIRDRIAEIDAQTAAILKERSRLQAMLSPPDVKVALPSQPIIPPIAPWVRPQPYNPLLPCPWAPEIAWEIPFGGTHVTICGTGSIQTNVGKFEMADGVSQFARAAALAS